MTGCSVLHECVNLAHIKALRKLAQVHTLFLFLLVIINFASSLQSTLFHCLASQARYLGRNCSLFLNEPWWGEAYVTPHNAWSQGHYKFASVLFLLILPSEMECCVSSTVSQRYGILLNIMYDDVEWPWVGFARPARLYYLARQSFPISVWEVENPSSDKSCTNASVFCNTIHWVLCFITWSNSTNIITGH